VYEFVPVRMIFSGLCSLQPNTMISSKPSSRTAEFEWLRDPASGMDVML